MRCLASFSYVIRSLLNLAVTVFTPCVALKAVIGLPYWASIVGITTISVAFTIMVRKGSTCARCFAASEYRTHFAGNVVYSPTLAAASDNARRLIPKKIIVRSLARPSRRFAFKARTRKSPRNCVWKKERGLRVNAPRRIQRDSVHLRETVSPHLFTTIAGACCIFLPRRYRRELRKREKERGNRNHTLVFNTRVKRGEKKTGCSRRFRGSDIFGELVIFGDAGATRSETMS